MPTQEAIADYYQRYGHGEPATSQITAYRLEDVAAADSYPHVRRDFYKIKLLCGAEGILSYADQRVAVQQCALIFVNPLIPYAWERTAGRETGFACLFTEEFSTPQLRTASVVQSPLFRVGSMPVVFPPPAAIVRIKHLFEELLSELSSSYSHKYEVLRGYVQLLLHEALKLQPPITYAAPTDGNGRIASLFLELLERQFPLENPERPLRLRTPQDYATALAVHVNYLNRAVRHVTGHTTTALLAGRLVREATTLLHHSTWPVAAISDALGFAYPTYFNTFYKKHTGHTPLQTRQAVV